MQIRIDEEVDEKVKLCKKLYREHHPEFDKIPLSKNKIINEMAKFYLDGTKYDK
jgi:hypothetical protein